MILAASSHAQSDEGISSIDPRLEELVQIVKSRARAPQNLSLRKSANISPDEEYLDLIGQLQTASYSRVPETILDAVVEFDENYKSDGSLGLDRIRALYTDYAQGLEDSFNSSELQDFVTDYTETGNWFEKYVALRHSAYLHGTDRELQAALQ